jgi:Tol biopolymer transport system component
MDAAMGCREAFLLVAILCGSARGQSGQTSCVSVDPLGAPGNDVSGYFGMSISADGRYVAFWSYATNLVPGNTNAYSDIFVRNRQTGTTERVSIDSAGVEGNNASLSPSISADGRYVAFQSYATNLVPGDTNGYPDIFVRDRQSGLTSLVSIDSAGAQGNGGSYSPSLSADGRFVAFWSEASNLVPVDANGTRDIFVRDRQSGRTSLVSVDSTGAQANGESLSPSISADGRFVAFESRATNLVPGDSNASRDVFVRDRQGGVTTRVSVDSAGAEVVYDSTGPSISADGRYVAFQSDATNLVPGDTNGYPDIFVRDRQVARTIRVSVDSAGAQGNGPSGLSPAVSISADGRHVLFASAATNLVPGDTNATADVFVHDLRSGQTRRVSVDTGGMEGNSYSYPGTISSDGRWATFGSPATNFVPGDTNGYPDVFVRDGDATSFTSFCDPGLSGVIPCPCSNPPAGPDRGCDNSSATGGAALSASGVANLSMDSLVFMTSSERPTALSIVLQGSASIPSGAVYGQGVRCVGGTFERLFVKTASGGSITAPDFGAGDPTVSARSAARGDPIQPGQSRFYWVYYRDAVVLGGCSASSTFNATQSGQVGWWP